MLGRSGKQSVRGDYDRAWLSDDYFDLIVWYTPVDTIHGFQLCYGKPAWERALTWLSDRGFSHMGIDDGEMNGWSNLSPILVPDGAFPAAAVVAEFTRRATNVPPHVRRFMLRKVLEFARRERRRNKLWYRLLWRPSARAVRLFWIRCRDMIRKPSPAQVQLPTSVSSGNVN